MFHLFEKPFKHFMVLMNSRQHKFLPQPNPLDATSIPAYQSTASVKFEICGTICKYFCGDIFAILNIRSIRSKYSQIRIYTFTHLKFLLHNLGPSTIPSFSVFIQFLRLLSSQMPQMRRIVFICIFLFACSRSK